MGKWAECLGDALGTSGMACASLRNPSLWSLQRSPRGWAPTGTPESVSWTLRMPLEGPHCPSPRPEQDERLRAGKSGQEGRPRRPAPPPQSFLSSSPTSPPPSSSLLSSSAPRLPLPPLLLPLLPFPSLSSSPRPPNISLCAYGAGSARGHQLPGAAHGGGGDVHKPPDQWVETVSSGRKSCGSSPLSPSVPALRILTVSQAGNASGEEKSFPTHTPRTPRDALEGRCPSQPQTAARGRGGHRGQSLALIYFVVPGPPLPLHS